MAKRKPVTEQLQELDESQLLGLLTKLLESNAPLADRIEAELALSEVSTGGDLQEKSTAPRRTLVDPHPIRKQAQRILRGAEGEEVTGTATSRRVI